MTDLQDQCIYCSWLDGKVYKVSPDCPVHSRDERKPGPPTSGEVGWYECEVEGMHGVHVLHWRYGSFYIEHFSDNDLHLNTRPALRAVTPLHDYPLRRSDKERSDEGPSMSANPLVPGDALREAEQTVRKLREELKSVREACRVAVEQQAREDDEVEELREERDALRAQVAQARREGFEAARACRIDDTGDHWIAHPTQNKYDTFEDYMRVANPEEEDQ